MASLDSAGEVTKVDETETGTGDVKPSQINVMASTLAGIREEMARAREEQARVQAERAEEQGHHPLEVAQASLSSLRTEAQHNAD